MTGARSPLRPLLVAAGVAIASAVAGGIVLWIAQAMWAQPTTLDTPALSLLFLIGWLLLVWGALIGVLVLVVAAVVGARRRSAPHPDLGNE